MTANLQYTMIVQIDYLKYIQFSVIMSLFYMSRIFLVGSLHAKTKGLIGISLKVSKCHFIVNWMTEPLVLFLWNVFVTSINANTFTQFTIWQIPCKMPNTKSASSQRQHSLSWRGSSKNPLSKDFIFRKIPIECHHISNKVLWITFTTSHTYTEI